MAQGCSYERFSFPITHYYASRNAVYMVRKGVWTGANLLWAVPQTILFILLSPLRTMDFGVVKWGLYGLIDGFKNKMGKTDRF